MADVQSACSKSKARRLRAASRARNLFSEVQVLSKHGTREVDIATVVATQIAAAFACVEARMCQSFEFWEASCLTRAHNHGGVDYSPGSIRQTNPVSCIKLALNPDASVFKPSVRAGYVHDASEDRDSCENVFSSAEDAHCGTCTSLIGATPLKGQEHAMREGSPLQGRWEPLSFLAESAIPALRATSRYHYKQVEELIAGAQSELGSNSSEELTEDLLPSQGLVRYTDAAKTCQAHGPGKGQPLSTRDAWVRAEWPVSEKLPADDLLHHFAQYGLINDMRWLDDQADTSVETMMKVHFEHISDAMEAIQAYQGQIKR